MNTLSLYLVIMLSVQMAELRGSKSGACAEKVAHDVMTEGTQTALRRLLERWIMNRADMLVHPESPI